MNTELLFDKYYYSQPQFVGGTTEFHALCGKNIPYGAKILEIGAGPSNSTSERLARIGQVTGVDVSEEVHENSALSAASTYDGITLPFDSSSFDACVSNYVLEHVQDSDAHFREVARVLRPGGVYCFRTPNLWHYISLASRLLPHAFHVKIANRLRGMNEAHEPWPTVYRANTCAVVQRLARQAGLNIVTLDGVEKEPDYGRAHPVLFFPMMCYERIVNSTDALRSFRANLFAVLRKE